MGTPVTQTPLNMYKFLIFSVVVAVAMAAGPPAYGPPPPAYHPAPYKEEKVAPQPYAYEYGVADDYSKANFKKTETQDAYGNVAGSFTIALPDGRLQTTTYTADHENGFIAEVTYSGEAQSPPEPAAGYGQAAPAYAPKPAYAPAPAYHA